MAAKEGYSKVSSFSDNFDDLDLEGSVIDEWHEGDPDFKKGDNKETPEIKYLLVSCTVNLDDGTHGFVFSAEYNSGIPIYKCHVCPMFLRGTAEFNDHVNSKLHCTNMQKSSHPHGNFSRIVEDTSMEVQPGEPVPPGMEDMIEPKKCLIQPKLDAYRSGPLIGLEFLVELLFSSNEPDYFCLLCEKQGIAKNILIHLTSQVHYLKYLKKYFPTVSKALSFVPKTNEYRKGLSVVTVKIVKKIEDKFGRLKPRQHTVETFPRKPQDKTDLLDSIEKEFHFRESAEDDYEKMVDLDEMKTLQFYNYEKPPATVLKTDLVFGQKKVPEQEPSKSTFKPGRINDKRQLRKDTDAEDNEKRGGAESPDCVIVIDDKDSSQEKRRFNSLSPVSAGSIGSPHKSRRSRSRTLRNRSNSRTDYRYRQRSRSRSGNRAYNQRRSPYHNRRSRSPSHGRSRRSRSRSRSPYHRGERPFIGRGNSKPYFRMKSRSPARRRSRSTSRSRGYSSYHRKDSRPIQLPYPRRRGSRSRSRSIPRSPRHQTPRSQSRSPNRYNRGRYVRPSSNRQERLFPEREDITAEKQKWEKFREDLKVLTDKLKFHEKNPEKHPQYSTEWKEFWNRRYKELQSEGKDPAKHDFKPEWISFWNNRMKELFEEEVKVLKEKLNEKSPSKDLQLDDVSDKSHSPQRQKDVTVDDIKNTWKALTGSDIKENDTRDYDPDRALLKVPTVINRNLRPPPGARLGFIPIDDNSPKVVSVLRLASVLESVLGSLGPKVVSLLSKALLMEKSCPKSSEDILYNEEDCVLFETVKEKLKGMLFAGLVERHLVNTTRVTLKNIEDLMSKAPKTFKKAESHTQKAVPSLPTISGPGKGVGTVNRMAIAEQIATTLIRQGRTDVTEEELEQLIDSVVQSSNEAASLANIGQQITNALQPHSQPLKERSMSGSQIGGLTMLQSAYGEGEREPVDNSSSEDRGGISPICARSLHLVSSVNVISNLVDYDLRVLLDNFKNLPPQDQQKINVYLKKIAQKDPHRVERLSKAGYPVDITGLTSKGRLSPFSCRPGSANPQKAEEPKSLNKFGVDTKQHLGKKSDSKNPADDEDDDDYSYEDIYKAASERIKQQQLQSESNDDEVMEVPIKAADETAYEELYKACREKVKGVGVEKKSEGPAVEPSPAIESNEELPLAPHSQPVLTGYPKFYYQQSGAAGAGFNDNPPAGMFRNEDPGNNSFSAYDRPGNPYPEENMLQNAQRREPYSNSVNSGPAGQYPYPGGVRMPFAPRPPFPDGRDLPRNAGGLGNDRFPYPGSANKFRGGPRPVWPRW